MRYRSTTPRKPPRSPGIDRWRLWMLFIALGLVLAVMRQLNHPATINRLDQLFGVDEQSSTLIEPTGNSADSLSVGSTRIDLPNEPPVAVEVQGVDLSAIRDKTYFRPEERPAWFTLLGQLQQWDEAQLAEETIGELTYAQLLKQPEVYRGRVVTLNGTVVREELQQLDDNPLGLSEYHRLWIQPRGGGQWPFVVYCLRLPSGFPEGEAIRAVVRVRGIFFKNWSYPWEDGLGIAPVILANQPNWQRPTPRPVRQRNSWQNWGIAIAIACVFAAGVTWLALSRTQRRPVHTAKDDAIRRRFSELTEEDGT